MLDRESLLPIQRIQIIAALVDCHSRASNAAISQTFNGRFIQFQYLGSSSAIHVRVQEISPFQFVSCLDRIASLINRYSYRNSLPGLTRSTRTRLKFGRRRSQVQTSARRTESTASVPCRRADSVHRGSRHDSKMSET